jgi:hypothetical protein
MFLKLPNKKKKEDSFAQMTTGLKTEFNICTETKLELNKYIDIDEDCSGIFSNQDIEATKLMLKSIET